MTADPRAPGERAAEELASRLARESGGGPAWTRYGEAAPALARACVLWLKARVDRLARSAPREAPAVADALVRAAARVPDLAPLALRGRAVAAHFAGRSADAVPDLERAAELYAARGDELEAARVKRSMVEVLHMAGRTEEALARAAEAARVFAALGEERLQGELDLNLGNLHTRLDEYPRARAAYTAARSRFEALGDRTMLAFADFNLGVVEMNADRLPEAEGAWRAARAGLEQAGMGVHVADCDYSLAYLESRRGRFDTAVRGLERARDAYAANGKPAGVPLCDLDLAEIHLRLDAPRDAFDLAERAALRFGELDMTYERARAELLRGLAAHRQGRAEDAARDLAAAAERFRGLGNEAWAAAVALQEGAIAIEAGRARDVIGALEDARDELRARELALLADLACAVLARGLLALGRPREALDELAERGAAQRGGVADGILAAEVRSLEAEAWTALSARGEPGARERAVACLRAAVDAIEGALVEVPTGDLRIAFFRDRHRAYIDLALLLCEGGGPGASGSAAEALAFLERGRARGLEEARGAPPGGDPELASARARLDWLLARRLDAELFPSGGGHDLRPVPPGDDDVRRAQEQVARLARAARGRPLAAGPASADAALAEGLSRALLPDEVALCYVVASGGARVLAATRAGVESAPLDVAPADVLELRDRLRLHAGKPLLGRDYLARRRADLRRTSDALLDELGRAFLAPVAKLVDGRPLLVVPFGGLHDLPFHAFRLGGRHLVELADVGYGPSLRHVARLRAERPEPGARRVLAAVAEDATLPAAREELAALERAFPGAVERVPAARLAERLRADPPRGGLLHVAGHGRFEAENPRFSGLALDGSFLLACDLTGAVLLLDHVTLSGCDTVRRRSVAGDELLGLPRAFLHAGARSVLGSLWAVDDGDAARTTAAFHGRLAAGDTVRRALSETQREALAGEREPLLPSWASFAVLGDPEARLAPAAGALDVEGATAARDAAGIPDPGGRPRP